LYSPAIAEKRLFTLAQRGVKVTPRSVDASISISTKLNQIAKEREFRDDEQEFIRSETVLCRNDFRYWAARYAFVELDASAGGGVGPIDFWESQRRALELIAKREEEIYEEYGKHGFSDGILSVWHKSRQLGATAIMRMISVHRMTTRKLTRCIAASLDEQKKHELYVRDKVILDNLPLFLNPRIEFDVKDQHISFEGLKSRISYQQANQQAGVGTGQQFDISHMTEVALWPNAYRLKFDFLPAVPQAPSTFVGFESTANGRGDFWHEFTEDIRLKHYGFTHWLYIFTPWYIESKKYRRAAPGEWTPGVVAQEHAELVERTSPDYAGKKVVLSRDQLYWWETEYEQNRKEGTLHMFLTNYCATPEQSFQHSTGSALPLETIEWMRAGTQLGMPYQVSVNPRAGVGGWL